MKKVFTSAPLPFMGQKRKFLKQFKPALNEFTADAIYNDNDNEIKKQWFK
ncbi:hypothetical protein ACIPCA_13055 [Flavobacterium covae]|uniref:Uncharacterized protein n=1 Tax=Flavobacterium covae TaxID=2906076 RepID=A0ABW8PJ58_9FLAO